MTLSNLAPLADAYALLKDQEKQIKARVEAAKEEILATGAKHLGTRHHTLRYSDGIPSRETGRFLVRC